MGKWKNGYKTLPNIGLYAGSDFQPPTFQSQWNWVHSDRSGLQRRWALEAQFVGGDYKGGSPASGIQISYSDLYSDLSTSDQELFALRFGTEASSPVLVVYGRRTAESTWQPSSSTVFTVYLTVTKRVYSDATTYTETTLGYADCTVYKPNTASVTASNIFLEFCRNNDTWFVGMSNHCFISNSIVSHYFLWNPVESDFLEAMGTSEVPETTPPKSPEYGTAAQPQGGYNEGSPHGTWDFSSDEIPIDPAPTLGVTSVGFINVYKVNQNDLISLGEKLFPHFLPAEILADPSTMNVTEMLAVFVKMAYGSLISPLGSSIEFADNLGVLDIIMNGKLIDYVLDCHVIPCDITGVTDDLKIGYRTFTDVRLQKASTDYVDVDCGTLNLKEVFGNFLDYNCKAEVYLPFVGFVPLDPEYWNNATLQVHYRFNIIDGSFQARLVSSRDVDGKECVLTNSVIAQYGGMCCVHFPITGLQYSNVVAGLVNGTTGAIASGVGGNPAGVATNLMNMAMLRPDVPMSNGYNASSSFLGQKTPYLVIKRPAPQFSETYPNEIGLPLNVTFKLSSLSGLTVIDNPVLNMNVSEREYTEIVNLMKEGIIL